MFTAYCQACGSKNQNPSFKPKFCQSCGSCFHLEITPQLAAKKDQESPDLDSEEGEISKNELYSATPPRDLSDLGVDVYVSKAAGVKILDLIDPNVKAVPIPSVKVPKDHHKKSLKAFQEEAGTLRKK